MTQYISKSAVVAEIESKKKCSQTLGDNAINGSMQQFYDGMKQGCIDILSFIDTIEVKEVDFETELDEWMKFGPHTSYPWCTIPDAIKITAEHFFELGLSVSNESQKG